MNASASSSSGASTSKQAGSHHVFVARSTLRKETCQACLHDVQLKLKSIAYLDEKESVKKSMVKKREDQIKKLYWDTSRKTANRNRHLCYCRHAEAHVKGAARLACGLDSLPSSSLPAPSTEPLQSAPAPPVAPASPVGKKRRSARTRSAKASYNEDSDGEQEPEEDYDMLDKEESMSASKKPKLDASIEGNDEKGKAKAGGIDSSDEGSGGEDSDTDSELHFEDYFAPSEKLARLSRSKSRSGTATSDTSLSTHSALSPTPKPPGTAADLSIPLVVASSSSSSSLAPATYSPQEARLINKIQEFLNGMLKRYRSVIDAVVPASPFSTFSIPRTSTSTPTSALEGLHRAISDLEYRQELTPGSSSSSSSGRGEELPGVEKAREDAILKLRQVIAQIEEGQRRKEAEESEEALVEAEAEDEEERAEKAAIARARRGYSPSQPWFGDDEIEVVEQKETGSPWD